MEKDLTKGVFITFEGPEGCGKSTQSRMVADRLKSDGYDVLHTAEPGDTELGARIREILLEKDQIPLSGTAEMLLFEADRAQHVSGTIIPALAEGKIVLCDRYNTATFAYQGYGLQMDLDRIMQVDDIATGGLVPDLTLILDIDIATGLQRASAGKAPDRLEKRGGGFHERVREGYLALAGRWPDRTQVIEVTGGIDETFGPVLDAVYKKVKEKAA